MPPRSSFARILLALGATVVVGVPLAFAQSTAVPETPAAPAADTPAVRFGYNVAIVAPTAIPLDRTVVLRAETPDTPPSGTFAWDVSDGTHLEGVEVTHSFADAGVYDIVLTHKVGAADAVETFSARHQIRVYHRAVVLFTTPRDTASQRALDDRATELGVALTTIPIQGRTPLLRQQELEELIVLHQEVLAEADTIAFALPSDIALSALITAAQRPSRDVLRQSLLVIADVGSTNALRLARVVADAAAPAHVLLTSDAALPLILELSPATLAKELLFRDIPILDVDTTTHGSPRWAFLSLLVDALLGRGIPMQTILLILLVPAIITVITFLRQVIGLNTMGLYVPVTMALAFVVLGPLTGLLCVVAIFGTGIGVRALLKQIRLLYVARIGLATSVVVLLLLIALLASAMLSPGAIPNLAIFPILVLALITERAYNVIAERGLRSSLLVFSETTLVALVTSVAASEWEWLRGLILTWPEVAIVFIALQLIIGKYTGLRATELVRFRELLNEVEYAEEEEE